MLGLECVVYMGEVDIHRQALNVFRMKLLGAEVRTVTTGSKTLKDAINEAIRDWVTNVRTTHYLIGSVVGPHPYPTMVRDFQSVIGKEARAQCLERMGRLPQAVLACVGGGSNAIGIFHPFVGDTEVELIGVEAAGRGLDTGEYAASLTAGRPGVLHGSYSYLLQDEHGQVEEAHSISAGLDYPWRRPGAQPVPRYGPRALRGGDRCRGHGGRAAAFPERGDHPGARAGARDPLRHTACPRARLGGRSLWSISPVAATRTCPRLPSVSGSRCSQRPTAGFLATKHTESTEREHCSVPGGRDCYESRLSGGLE